MFGRDGARPGAHDVIVGDVIVGDDQWHQIDIKRNKHEVRIILDITRKDLTGEQVQDYQNITVAGLPLSIPSNTPRNTSIPLRNPRTSSLPTVSLTGSVFKGCMEDVTFNEINIFQATKDKSKDVRVLGTLWPKCADDAEYPPATLSKSTSYIKLDAVNGQDVNLKFKFLTFDHTGVLVHHSFGSSVKDGLFLELVHGKLMWSCASQNLNINTIISPKYTSYADGLWHSIQLNLTSRGMAIRVNNETAKKFMNSSAFKNLLQNPMLKIGTSLKDKPSMKGCVREIQLNGKDIEVTSSISQDVALDECYLTDLCFMNPCFNDGVCQQHNNTIQCDCSNTDYYGSRCQNISTIKPSLTTSKIIKAIPKSTKKDSTVQPSTTTPDKLPITLPSKLQTIHTTQSSKLITFLRNTSQSSKPSQSIRTMTKKISTVQPSQFLSSITKRTTGGQLNQPMTPTSGQILTGKPKRVIATKNENISTVKPKQSSTSKSKQTLSAPTKQSLPATRSLGTHLSQATISISKLISTDQLKQIITSTSTVQVKQSPTRKQILTAESNQSTPPNNKQTTTPRTKQSITPSASTLDQSTLHLTLPKRQKPTRHTTLSTHQRQTLHTTENPTHKMNTQIIVIQNSNTITKVGFNKNQLLVYLFLFIVFVLFVGLIVIISVKMSYFNACPCLRRFQTVNGSLPSQDSIELGQRRKDSTTAVRVKTDRPSSLNDSGIDRSESGTDSHRSSAEVQDDAVNNREDQGTRLGDRVDLETSPDSEGFLILQDDPSLYTQKSFGWTILNSTNTIRHCRTSTRDLIHAANENKPHAFKPAYYPHSEISDDVRVDAGDDVTRCRNPTTKYRQLATSDCSSLDNVSIDMEQCLGLETNSGEECPVF